MFKKIWRYSILKSLEDTWILLKYSSSLNDFELVDRFSSRKNASRALSEYEYQAWKLKEPIKLSKPIGKRLCREGR